MKDSSFCCFCFSRDRKTWLIEKNELEIFNAVSSKEKELMEQLYYESKLNMCFECRGRIRSLQKFIKRTKVSVQILKNYWTSSNHVLPDGYKILSQSKKILIQYLPPKNQKPTEKTNTVHTESKYLTKTVKVEKIKNYLDTPEHEVSKSGAAMNFKPEDVTTYVGNSSFVSADVVEQHGVHENQQRQVNDIKVEDEPNGDEYSSVDVTEQDVEPNTSDRVEDIEDILLSMVTGPVPKSTECRKKQNEEITACSEYTIEPSTSALVEDFVEVRTSSDSDGEFGIDFTEITKNKKNTKSITKKPKQKPIENGWLNLWVSEEQALSWRRTDIEQQTCVDDSVVCDLCKQGFKGKEELKRHLFWHHYDVERGVTCNICNYIFKNHLALHQHAKYHYVLYKCDRCDYQTRDLNLIQTHTGPEHISVGNEAWQISTLIPVTILNYCKKCKIYFTTESQYLNHAELYGCHNLLTKCDFCSKVFASKSLKVEHLQRFHDQPFSVECNICKRKFKSAKTMKIHMKKKHYLENYMEKKNLNGPYCEKCDLFFENTTHYNYHLQRSSKHAAMKHKCPHCDQKFSCPQYLQKHIGVVHLKIRSFRCEKCPKAYTKRRNLELHVSKVHDKNFVQFRDKICDVCGKGFMIKSTLDDHKNVHTGERPYKCPLCPSTFGFKAALFTHNKLVHLKQKRACDLKKMKKKPV